MVFNYYRALGSAQDCDSSFTMELNEFTMFTNDCKVVDRGSKACKRADLDLMFKMVNVERGPRDDARPRSQAESRANSEIGSDDGRRGGAAAAAGGDSSGDDDDDDDDNVSSEEDDAFAVDIPTDFGGIGGGGSNIDPSLVASRRASTTIAEMRRVNAVDDDQKAMDEWNADRSWMRFEWLEGIVVIAVAKYVTEKMCGSAWAAVDQLVVRNIHANLGNRIVDSNHFRRTRLYNEHVEQVLRKNLYRCADVFSGEASALYNIQFQCC